MEIPMTAPVTMRMIPGQGRLDVFEMCFWIPSNMQGKAPKPSGKGVSLVKRPAQTFYVK